MTWGPNQGSFDPEKHARRKEEKARERERLAEQQRQERARLETQETERAARVGESLSQDIQTRPSAPERESTPQVAAHGNVPSAPTPTTGPDSYRLTRSGVGCWGFIGLYILFFILFSMGSSALVLIDEGLGSIAMIGAPILAYFMWRNFYRQYRGWIGFLAVGGGLLVIGFFLLVIVTLFIG